jgi:hypothetical protein
VILKEYIRLPARPDLDRDRYLVDMEVQTVCAKLGRLGQRTILLISHACTHSHTHTHTHTHTQTALDFRELLRDKFRQSDFIEVKFLMAKVLCIRPGEPDERFMSLEKEYHDDTDFVKFTNNYKVC